MDNCILTIPAEEYHADRLTPTPSLSKGCLQTLLTKSALHAHREHPRLGSAPHEEATKLDYGSAAHAMLFEGGKNIVVVAADDWRTKKAKEERDAARAEGKFPILEYQHEKVATMAGRARKFIEDSFTGYDILADGKPEQSVYWQEVNPEDPLDSIWCRARTDFLTNSHSIILDYKSTEMPNPAAFCRGMYGMGYDLQDAFYRRGVQAVTGRSAAFYFLVQEVSEPFACYLVECSPAMREVGESRMKRGMKLWWDCLKRDKWPAYGNAVYTAEAQPWTIMAEEEAS